MIAPIFSSAQYYTGLRSYQIPDVLNAEVDEWNLWYDPRLGKTRVLGRCILRWIHDFGLMTHLIVGPLTPLEVTWQREMRAIGFDTPSNGGGSVGYLIPLLRHEDKVKWVGEIVRDLLAGAAGNRPIVILLNDEVLNREGAFGVRGGRKSIVDLLCELGPDTLTIDEADRYSHAGSGRTEALRRLGRYTKKRRALTGTPDPNGIMDLYSQFVIIAPDVFGTNKKRFMDRYVITRDLYGREIIGYRNEDEFWKKALSISSIARAKDFFDVPPVEDIPRFLELGPGIKSIYKTLKDTDILELDGIDIDATHQLAKLTRLSQLAIGYLPVDDPDTDEVAWLHTTKIDSVVADCSEPLYAGQKLVISHLWKPEGEKVAAALRKKYGERVVVELNGSVTKDRNAIVAPFDIDQDVVSDARIMVAQEVTGGVGISFARADHLHFLSHSMDWGDVYQMHKRTWHESKRRLTETYHMASGTVDVWKRSLIRRKESASIMLKETGYRQAAEGMAP